MKVLLVDDESLSLKTTEYLLTEYCRNVSIIGTAKNINDAKKIIESEKPDLVLLDIKMPGGTGFDLLNNIENPEFQVVFITAFDQFAIKAFEYSAIDYLLKPYPTEKLIKAIDKAQENLKNKTYFEHLKALSENQDAPSVLIVKGQNKTQRVEMENISFLQADNNYTIIFNKEGKKVSTSSKTLKYYEEILPEDQFFRVHVSFIVNRLQIKTVNPKNKIVVLNDGTEVSVAHRRVSELKKWLAKFSIR